MDSPILTTIIQGGSFAALIYFGWYVISGYRKQNDDFLVRIDKLHSEYQKRLDEKHQEHRKDLIVITGSLEQVSTKLEALSVEVKAIKNK
jgi:hypothetical protein